MIGFLDGVLVKSRMHSIEQEMEREHMAMIDRFKKVSLFLVGGISSPPSW